MEVKISPYRSEHHEVFKQLNIEWLDHYNLTESHDLMVLNDPEGTILNRGGFIWLAEAEGKIVGSAALMKEQEGEYELAKMSVAPAYRGKGISKLLIERCLFKAKAIGAKNFLCFPIINCKQPSGCMKNMGSGMWPCTTHHLKRLM